MACKCELCEHGNKFYKMIEKLPKDEQKWMSDFYSLYMNVSEDLEYYRSIMAGCWPSAVEILARALKEAKRIKAEEK